MQSTGIRQAVSALPEEITCCVLSLCVAQIQIIAAGGKQEVEIMHAFWWISNQCTGGKRAFCQKCPGAVRVLSAPGAGWKRQFVFQANQTYFSLQFPPAPRHHGNPLAKKRHFLAGKTGGFSLCSLGSRGINPLVDILGGLSFHQCPRRAEQGDVQAGVRAGITPRPPPIPHPTGHQDQVRGYLTPKTPSCQPKV